MSIVDSNISRNIDKIIDHKESFLSLNFNTNMKKDPCDASYGITDLSIYAQ